MLTADLVAKYVRRRGPFLFHVTDNECVDSILRQGLVPGAREPNFDPHLSRPRHIYLCTHRTAIWSLSGYFDCTWGNCVLRVDVRHLNPRRFNADEENWRGEHANGFVAEGGWRRLKRLFPQMDAPENVYLCLLSHGTIAYRGEIPATAIELCCAGGARIRPRRRMRQLAIK